MSAIDERGKRLEDTAATGSSSGDTADVDFVVPTGKRWLLDTVKVGADAAVNDIELFFMATDGSGTATSGGATTLTDTGQAWDVNAWRGGTLFLTGGTGVGQSKPISSNTATVITVGSAWATNPDSTTTYEILMDVWDEDDPPDLTNTSSDKLIRLLERYPKSFGLEAGDTLRGRITTDEAVAKTLTMVAWLSETNV